MRFADPGRESLPTGFRVMSREHQDAHQRVGRSESRHRLSSAGCQENTRTPTDALVGLLRESPERPLGRSSCPSSEEDPLEHSGTQQGRMETLLAPARATR
ncbi:unnamed protein product [Heligmosomoides polygyrus]|uniref:Uncharacterized protein n=1 Tax=Heligmosomoides polygyrus TaxID=6339 RepID=A0A183FK34_HELPZ|nr:unnamed protein product [Heligmosomoides polygyrus]